MLLPRTSEKKLRVAVYVRFSEAELQSGTSSGDQEHECRRFAESEGWEVVGLYADEGVRAGNMRGRLSYQRLREDARRGLFDAVLIWAVSRLSRRLLTGMRELDELLADGVIVLDTKGGKFTDDLNDLGRFFFEMYGAQKYTDDLAQNARRGLTGQVRRGFWPGGRAPFGYALETVYADTPDKYGQPVRLGRRVVPDPKTAPIVFRIFNEYAAGSSKNGIARRLTDEGVSPPGASTIWNRSGIKAILENEIYGGTFRYGRMVRSGRPAGAKGKKKQHPAEPAAQTVREDFCDALVPKETIAVVRARLTADQEAYVADGRQRGPRGRGGAKYLLTGLLRCGTCGRNYVISDVAYRCAAHVERTCPNKHGVPRVAIEKLVIDFVERTVKDPAHLAKLVAEHNARIDEVNGAQLESVRRIEREIEERKKGIENLLAAIEASPTSKALAARITERESEVVEFERRLAEARKHVLAHLQAEQLSVTELSTGEARLLTGDVTRDRELLRAAIEAVEVNAGGYVVIRFRRGGLFDSGAAEWWAGMEYLKQSDDTTASLSGARRVMQRVVAQLREDGVERAPLYAYELEAAGDAGPIGPNGSGGGNGRPTNGKTGSEIANVPTGIRTPVADVKSQSPWPLDDGDVGRKLGESGLSVKAFLAQVGQRARGAGQRPAVAVRVIGTVRSPSVMTIQSEQPSALSACRGGVLSG